MISITIFSRIYYGITAIEVTTVTPYEATVSGGEDSKQHDEMYDYCIPIEALNIESGDEYFIYIVENTNTVLGNQLIVQKIPVDVLDSDESMAALDGIDGSEEVITFADKPISENKSIKRQDQ